MSNENKNEVVAAQHEMIGNVAAKTCDYVRTTHPDAQWFPEAALGLFIHWGLSSLLGKCDLSWGMMNNERGKKEANLKVHGLPAVGARMTPNEYWEQAKHFNPDRYDPNKWLAAAKKAGMEYCVLTTKHHEGFAMWPSEFGDFNTKNYMGGRDLVGEYVEACRKNGLKVGFYYSPPDWYWERNNMSFNYGNRQPRMGLDHEPRELPVLSEEEQRKYDDALNQYVRGQVTELLTRYGKIDIIWFDGNLPQKEKTISMEEIHALQPGILVNPRGHGYGDYKTPECRFPEQRFDKKDWWELCYVFADGAWGYLNHECYKPNGWLLWELGKVRSWDGNFLPNVGPDGHGELPHAYYQRMEELANWMAHSGEAIKGVTGGPWPEQCNVPVTCNASAWYLHVHWVWDETVELKDVDKPEEVTCLRTGDAIDFTYENRTLSFVFPSRLKTILTDIVKVVW
jgi:alpha-L-fucosidase